MKTHSRVRSAVPIVALLVGLVLAATGCSSTTNHAILTGPAADGAGLLRQAHDFEDLGPVEGRACRYFVLAVIPFGNSAVGEAMQNALAGTGGDAILNASVTTSLYGFIPIYNVLSFTCTTVQGVAIKTR